MQEAEEVKEVSAEEKNSRIAAFFDLDGTLVALPSLERRFIPMLRYRRAIPVRNYFFWMREAVRLMPRGITAVLQGNKMYLRGVPSFDERDAEEHAAFPPHKSGHQAEGQGSAPSSRGAWSNPRLPVPDFFEEGVKRVAWHAKQGHAIVIVSGTLEPLASAAALSLILRLAVRGITSLIGACATKLEEADGRWTGRVFGEAMFGEAKARAVGRIASEMKLDLTKCYAYGDSVDDRWLLEAVGRPVAVNPSKELGRMARRRGWPVLRWDGNEIETQRRRGHRENKTNEAGNYEAARRQRTDDLDVTEFAGRNSGTVG